MRTSRSTLAVCASILAAGGMLAIAGPLSPPAGPVASSYKTLTEVEPRTAINATNTPGNTIAIYRITQPGSYYLTGNINAQATKHAIEVTASQVTIDLCGYTINGTGATGVARGVSVANAVHNLTIRNGTIYGWVSYGVFASLALNVKLEDLMFSSNAGTAVFVGGNAVITRCVSLGNAGYGFQCASNAVITDCSARDNSDTGFYTLNGSMLRGCSARGNLASGISTGGASVVETCSASGNQAHGIVADIGSMVSRCTASQNNIHGIVIATQGVVEGCVSTGNGDISNSGAGVRAEGTGVRVESNNVASNRVGIAAPNGNCFIVRNSASLNVTNYDLHATNDYGAIVPNPGAGFSSSNSWANFAY